MKYEFIIFDMDGLMFDTEIMYYNSWFNFTDKYGFTYNKDIQKQIAGLNEKSIHRFIADELKSDDKATELRRELNNYRNDFFNNYKDSLKKPGLTKLLEFMDDNGIKACVASSNSRDRVEFLLDKEGIGDYFSFIISGDEFKESKPNPEIFLTAYEKSGFPKDNCLILEDSYNGYLASKASEIDYRIIYDTSMDEEFEADYTADNLEEIIEVIKGK